MKGNGYKGKTHLCVVIHIGALLKGGDMRVAGGEVSAWERWLTRATCAEALVLWQY
jgi:hypothetical protein